jgi:hypothetical protein
LWIVCGQAATAATVSLDSLLDEMTDRAALAQLPNPAYTCKQFSSYNRAAKAPGKPGWFANGDWSYFVREEANQGRTEWVLMDAEGPGAIVRWWVTGKGYAGTIRIYLDGAEDPVIAARVDELVGGDALVGPPLSAERARGRNFYLPIPYAKRCKVTFDRNFRKSKKREDRLFYQINYRTYAPGTDVKSFDMAQLKAAKKKIAAIDEKLLNPASVMPAGANTIGKIVRIRPRHAKTVKIKKSRAICKLSIKLGAKDPVQALRSTILAMEFDDEKTVWCPVGDFFGGGVGVNPYQGWCRRVDKDGAMTCWWVMPFKKECKLTLKNLGKQVVEGTVAVTTCPWKWDDRSMHFHSNWRAERNIETADGGKKAFDWNFLKAQGQGVFVGDSLAMVNRVKKWWGEGDEKIFVDGEAFPSHFGTGTEDYYGYAWSQYVFFDAPFHAQPRAEGPRNRGNVTNTRVRALDAIPFDKSLVFDMEIWHIRKTTVDYAATTYWYGRPGARAVMAPMDAEAVKPVKYNTK